jgi:RNA polymerase sigma factor (sigma-70 family)
VEFDELLTSNYELIEKVIAYTARRYRLNAADAEEFGSIVRFKLVANDYEILRKFRQESSLRTFLTIVIQRLCLDFRTAQWGKWRPSAEAKRQGPVAVQLERLMIRDGYTFEEACELLRTNHGVEIADDELERLRTLRPPRPPRRHVDEAELASVASTDPDAESVAMQSEAREKAARFWKTLDELLAKLDPQDRLIIELRFKDGLTLAQISRALRLEQPPLYRRQHNLLAALREQLLEARFAASEIGSYLANWSGNDEEPPGPNSTGGNAGGGPSL